MKGKKKRKKKGRSDLYWPNTPERATHVINESTAHLARIPINSFVQNPSVDWPLLPFIYEWSQKVERVTLKGSATIDAH